MPNAGHSTANARFTKIADKFEHKQITFDDCWQERGIPVLGTNVAAPSLPTPTE